jgi:hypothetical protein
MTDMKITFRSAMPWDAKGFLNCGENPSLPSHLKECQAHKLEYGIEA